MHVRQEAAAVAFHNPRGFGFHGPSLIRELPRPLKGWAQIQHIEFKKAHAPFRALMMPRRRMWKAWSSHGRHDTLKIVMPSG